MRTAVMLFAVGRERARARGLRRRRIVVNGRGDRHDTTQATTPATTAETPTTTDTTTTTTTTPKPRTIMVVVEQGRPRGGITRPTIAKGDKVLLVVRTDTGEEVHVHGYDIEKPVTPGTPVRIPFTARSSGPVRARAPPSRRAARGAGGAALSLRTSSPTGSGRSRTSRCRRGCSTGAPRSSWSSRSSCSACSGARRCSRRGSRTARFRRRSRASSSGRAGSSRRRSRSCSSSSSGCLRCSGTPTRSGTSRRPGSTSSSGSASRRSPSSSATSGAASRPGARSRTRSSGSGSSAGNEAKPLAEYPERLGRWPAAVMLLAFVALELAYSDPASPRALAFAIALYTYVALFGMAAFGRDTWEGHGEGFAVMFRYSRSDSPVARRGRPDPPALAAHRARRRRARPRVGGVRRRDARLGAVRRLQPDDDLAGSRLAGREPVHRRASDRRRAARDAPERGGPAHGSPARRARLRGRVRRGPLDGERAPLARRGLRAARSCRSRSSTCSPTTSRYS